MDEAITAPILGPGSADQREAGRAAGQQEGIAATQTSGNIIRNEHEGGQGESVRYIIESLLLLSAVELSKRSGCASSIALALVSSLSLLHANS